MDCQLPSQSPLDLGHPAWSITLLRKLRAMTPSPCDQAPLSPLAAVGPLPTKHRVCGTPLGGQSAAAAAPACPLRAGLHLPAVDWELGAPLPSLVGQMGNWKQCVFQGHPVSWEQSPGSNQVFLVLGLVTFPWPSLVWLPGQPWPQRLAGPGWAALLNAQPGALTGGVGGAGS